MSLLQATKETFVLIVTNNVIFQRSPKLSDQQQGPRTAPLEMLLGSITHADN